MARNSRLKKNIHGQLIRIEVKEKRAERKLNRFPVSSPPKMEIIEIRMG